MLSLVILAVFGCVIAVPIDEPPSFSTHKVLTTKVLSPEHLKAAEQLEHNGIIDLWSHSQEKDGSILFSAAEKNLKSLQNHFNVTVIEDDLQKIIDETRQTIYEAPAKRRAKFTQFEVYDQIVASLEFYTENFPAGHAEVFTLGKAWSGKDIRGISISRSASDKKPIVFMECGIHAREWASISTCLYIIDQLIFNSEEQKQLLDRFEFHIVPASNPDGYEYTHTVNRLWRKNRTPQLGRCIGVDLNRNFGTGGHCKIGASTNPCAETFCGTAAFSEPETRAIRDYISKIRSRIEYYVSLHAFGLMWMFPYSYTEKLCADHKDLLRRTKLGVDAIKAETGTQYSYGPIAETIYAVSGSSIDWAYDEMKIRKPFVLELQPSVDFRFGSRGFLLSPSQIAFVGKETFTGLKTLWLS